MLAAGEEDGWHSKVQTLSYNRLRMYIKVDNVARQISRCAANGYNKTGDVRT